MKERIIRISVLSVVFVLALFVLSHLLNKKSGGTTAAMGSATFPTISFQVEGTEVNVLAGHVNEMDISAMRDTITPLEEDGTLQGNIQLYENAIESFKYELYTLDGQEKLFEKTKEDVEDSVKLQLGENLKDGEEAVLKISLSLEEAQTLHFYTRVIQSKDLYMKECLNYVQTLHENMLKNANTDDIKKVLESNETGDNTTLQHVNIHSNVEHAAWGDLKPEIVSQVRYDVKETKAAYTSVLLNYQVKCAGDNNEEEFFDVNEFFKIRYVDGEHYLLTYDRTMNEIFDGSNVVLMSKGINLGLTDINMQYKVNQDGTIVSFIQNNELWSYNKEENEFVLVFSFAKSEKEDIRNRLGQHSLKILSMEEDGNITFGVYGYMNRGIHEGESGVAIYYFQAKQNVVEEKAFIPSTQSNLLIEKKLGEVACYNNGTNILYLLAEGSLYKIDLENEDKTILLEGLEAGEYVPSEDGQLIAYLKNEEATEVEVLNFKADRAQNVKVEEGEMIIPLGFVLGDFVYGVSKPEHIGKTSSGETVAAMYKVEIRDAKNEVVKTYQADGTFILDVAIENNMITLKRAEKQGSIYVGISEDYITNNEKNGSSVALSPYWTNLKETQMRLVFEDGIDHKRAKVSKSMQILDEQETTLAFEQNSSEEFYCVYGHGKMSGVYVEAGEAIQKAKEVSGVVVSPEQRYIWEDGNRVAWYRNFEMGVFTAKAGESTLAASIREVLAYEGKEVAAAAELEEKSAFEILDENADGEAVQLQDCSSKDVFYLIDKGVPVIAMTDNSNAIVLIGYDARTVTYIDPSSGSIKNRTIEVVDKMTNASGNTFLVYVK